MSDGIWWKRRPLPRETGVDTAGTRSRGKSWHPAWWAVALVATITVASGFPTAPEIPESAVSIPHFDKVAHFFVFGLVATLILRPPKGTGITAFRILVAVALTSAFGLADEFHQSTNPVRFFSWWDWVADTAGAVVAVTAYAGWRRYREILEFRLGWSR